MVTKKKRRERAIKRIRRIKAEADSPTTTNLPETRIRFDGIDLDDFRAASSALGRAAAETRNHLRDAMAMAMLAARPFDAKYPIVINGVVARSSGTAYEAWRSIEVDGVFICASMFRTNPVLRESLCVALDECEEAGIPLKALRDQLDRLPE